MTVEALLNIAQDHLAGDCRILVGAESTLTCDPWSSAAGIERETGGQADDRPVRRGARSAAGAGPAA